MPYYKKGKCVYKKNTNKKVGCTEGSVDDYMKALHANVNESLEAPLDFKSVLPSKKYDYLVTYNLDSQNDILIGHKNGEAETVFLHRLGDIVHGKKYTVLAQIGSESTPETGPYSKNTRSILQYNLPKLSKKLKTPQDVESFIEVFVSNSYDRIDDYEQSKQGLKEPYEEGFEFEVLCTKILSE
jgi:hypothetical protein